MVSFLFIRDAVFIKIRLLSVAFNNFFKTLFSLEFWIANVCHFFKRIISSWRILFSNFKLLNWLYSSTKFENAFIGAEINLTKKDYLPLMIHGNDKLLPFTHNIEKASAQIKSALIWLLWTFKEGLKLLRKLIQGIIRKEWWNI